MSKRSSTGLTMARRAYNRREYKATLARYRREGGWCGLCGGWVPPAPGGVAQGGAATPSVHHRDPLAGGGGEHLR